MKDQLNRIEGKVDKMYVRQENINTRLNFLVTEKGEAGVLLPKCEKRSIKSTLRAHRWIITIYGTLIVSIIGVVIAKLI